MTQLKSTLLGISLILLSNVAQATTIIKPGQCIVVAGTEVCASQPTKEQCNEVETKDSSDEILTCRYDNHQGSETPGLKTYALISTKVTTYGRKIETIVKNYGLSDKDACEADAAKKR